MRHIRERVAVVQLRRSRFRTEQTYKHHHRFHTGRRTIEVKIRIAHTAEQTERL